MKRLSIIRVVAVLCSGLMAGLLFGDWLGPSFARAAMNASSFIQFQQIVHINYLRTLPALSTIAVGYTITFVFNVPVNNQLETWDFAAPPANAREIWSHWEKAHVVRTIFWVTGFFL